MIIKTPSTFFLVTGCAEGFMPLNAFDNALRDAGIADLNLIRLSSILPPCAKEIEYTKLPYGALVPTAYAEITNQTPENIISAAVAVAIPEDPTYPGLIMEYSAIQRMSLTHKTVIEMAKRGMETRGREIKQIRSIAIEHTIKNCGCAFAAVILWD